ncbi:GIY-YIG nuclease domain-containing protein YeeC [Rhizobium phaseoli]|uniref:GIY-YIG nuclease family protein n=1 Tax=Rhizobium phaseoli TaxID=396 RepID=UPI0007EBBB5D|nr:GIY-YIG nuclease family protein [Rhizobium phaseoli]ANL28600.1 GIY-YIG nuclease domain-containing protein YeeC [Rhizobium phaseoli]
MEREKLLALIEDDDLGLLKVKPKGATASSSSDRLIASFGEINDFIRKHDRIPTPNQKDVQEYRLYSRLESLRQDKAKASTLGEYDEFGLLTGIKEIKTIDDIFEDDEFGILDDAATSIFDLKHVPKQTTMPDYIGSRKPCEDFDQFEPLLRQCQADLAAEKRRLWPFAKEQQIHEGLFFVLKGVLLYVAEVGDREITGGKNNARLRCIFENGTESDMLLRSLAAELYKDGRRVLAHEDRLLDGFDNISDDDQETGFIYVLKSLSDRTEIKTLENLFKIGFCRGTVVDRVRNAAQDPTFLMAPVAIVTAYKCFNMNPVKLEQLLHRFFGEWCLNVDVLDRAGQRHVPREWFTAPLDVIEQAVHLVISGEIVEFQYDGRRKEIVARSDASI